MPTMPVQWKLRELLEREGVTAYKLAEQMGGATRRPTLYAITSPDKDKRPAKVGFALLDDILAGLRGLTGKQFSVADLIETDEVRE